MTRLLVLVLLLLLLPAAPVAALEVAVIYGAGGRFDKGFNESAYAGVQEARRRLGLTVREIGPADQDQLLKDAATADVVVGIGPGLAEPIAEMARREPGRLFAVIDGTGPALPNLRLIRFNDHEAAFLAGILAGMASRSGLVGFIGASGSPVTQRLHAGFRQGVAHARPEARVTSRMIEGDGRGFLNPMAGYEMAEAMIGSGADVLFAAAGLGSLGVHQAARDSRALSIGADANQNRLFPGTVLTSVVRRADLAALTLLTDAAAGRWPAGETVLGLAQGGVDLAIDQHNRPLLGASMLERLIRAREEILAGRLRVIVEQ